MVLWVYFGCIWVYGCFCFVFIMIFWFAWCFRFFDFGFCVRFEFLVCQFDLFFVVAGYCGFGDYLSVISVWWFS